MDSEVIREGPAPGVRGDEPRVDIGVGGDPPSGAATVGTSDGGGVRESGAPQDPQYRLLSGFSNEQARHLIILLNVTRPGPASAKGIS